MPSLVLLLILFCSALPAFACSCGSAAHPVTAGGPILVTPAYTLKQSELVFGSSIFYQNWGKFDAARLAKINRERRATANFDSAMELNLYGAYGITDDLSISVNLPYIFRYDQDTTYRGVNIDDGNIIGWGDMSIFSQYRFFKSDCWGLQLAAITGIKMPTGYSHETNEFGIRFGSDDQPSTRSWDPIMGLAVSKVKGPFTIDASAIYNLSTKSEDGLVVGDSLNYGLAFSYAVREEKGTWFDRLFPTEVLGLDLNWALVFEILGQWQERAEFGDIQDFNSGGQIISLSPGVTLDIEQKVVLNLSTVMPVVEALNGEQSDPGLGLFFSANYIF